MPTHIATSYVFTPCCLGVANHLYIYCQVIRVIMQSVDLGLILPRHISLKGPKASSLSKFLDDTQRRCTVGRTSLDEWSALHRDLYLTTHNTHNRHTSMLPAGFEPAIPASEWPQTHALDRAATGIGSWFRYGERKCGIFGVDTQQYTAS